MNGSQGMSALLGLIAIIVLCLRPLYQWEHTTYVISFQNVPHVADTQTTSIGHCWIWDPPKGWEESLGRERKSHVAVVDWPRLGVYVGLVIVTTLFLIFVLFNRKTAPTSQI